MTTSSAPSTCSARSYTCCTRYLPVSLAGSPLRGSRVRSEPRGDDQQRSTHRVRSPTRFTPNSHPCRTPPGTCRTVCASTPHGRSRHAGLPYVFAYASRGPDRCGARMRRVRLLPPTWMDSSPLAPMLDRGSLGRDAGVVGVVRIALRSFFSSLRHLIVRVPTRSALEAALRDRSADRSLPRCRARRGSPSIEACSRRGSTGETRCWVGGSGSPLFDPVCLAPQADETGRQNRPGGG